MVQKMNEQQYERTHTQVDKWTTSKWTSDQGSNEQMNKLIIEMGKWIIRQMD